jgi:putative phosphoesterase
MKIAVISDIHGNSIALQEVIKDIRNRGADTTINLGDSLYGPLDPKGTYDLLVSNDILSLSGNEDRIILENLYKESNSETLEYVKSQLDKTILEWLKSLPFHIINDWNMYCCHGTPQSDTEYLLEKLVQDCISVKESLEIDKLLINIKQNIIVCGHSHISNIIETNGRLIVNPGSLGLPAYDDDIPIFHRMQNYNPRANYAILNINRNSVSVERFSIDYNYEQSATLAMKNNRPDWAEWIKTGMAKNHQ